MKWQLVFFYLPDLFIVLLAVPAVTTEGFLMSSRLFRLCLSLRIKAKCFLFVRFSKLNLELSKQSLSLMPLFEMGFRFLWRCHLRQYITCAINCLLQHPWVHNLSP